MKRSTFLVLAAAAVPALASAQQGSQDSTRAGQQSRTVRGESAGRLSGDRGGRGNMGLDEDQVRQVQQALSDAGCNPGTVDGRMGPRTRSAMSCARRKNNLTGNNTNELLRSLNLSFTVDDSVGTGSLNRSGNRGGRSGAARGDEGQNGATSDSAGSGGATGAVRGNSGQTGGANRGRIRPTADSARGGAANAQSPGQAQHGGGMHDSTTSTNRPPR